MVKFTLVYGHVELFLKLFSTWPFDARLHAISYPNDHMKNNILSSLVYGTHKINENEIEMVLSNILSHLPLFVGVYH